MSETGKTTNRFLIAFIIVIVIVLVSIVIHNYYKSTTNKETKDSTNYSADISNAGETITSSGTHKISGDTGCVLINTSGSVELILENATITCQSGPAVNVEKATNVDIALIGENKITSSTTEELDGAIYSTSDLSFSGTGSLTIVSNYDGIVSKDNLVINDGKYIINAEDDGIRGRDSVKIANGEFSITVGGDGIKSTNDEDAEKGYIEINGGTFSINSVMDGIQAETNLVIKKGTFNIKTSGDTTDESAKGLKSGVSITIEDGAFTLNTTDDGIHSDGNITINNGEITISSKDDGIHGDGLVEVNGGTLSITAKEGIEGTYVKINGGKNTISATDDGINAGNKSNAYSVRIEINGGNTTIIMGQGDTDAIDSNGDIYVNGGTLNITAQSPFDYDGSAKYTGGTIIVNGTTINQITNQMMGRPGENENMVDPRMDQRNNQRRGMR